MNDIFIMNDTKDDYSLYDVAIIGAGPGGYFAAYELLKSNKNLNIKIFDKGNALEKRVCPISIGKVNKCIKCNPCNIMTGIGGCGSFSDGKFNITNDFGGNLWEKIGKENAIELMNYVDSINYKMFISHNPDNVNKWPSLFSSKGTKFKKLCLQNNLHLLDADIRHLGTDYNYDILVEMFEFLKKNGISYSTNTEISTIDFNDQYYVLTTDKNKTEYHAKNVIVATGRSGSKWINNICSKLKIPTESNRVDIGVRVELPYEIFSELTDELYESKIVYKTKTYEDNVRTFCMNPKGTVVSENTNGIITVNGHSFESEDKKTKNTNFALLVSMKFTEPFNDSSSYAESIVKLSNMIGGGVLVQRFGDLIRGKRSTIDRINNSSLSPTLNGEPGDLSLVLPKRILDDIIEMIKQLDKVVPGTANDDTLLYGVECKFYNNQIKVNNNLEANDYKGLYFIGDGSGITHSLSQAAASGVHVAKDILNRI